MPTPLIVNGAAGRMGRRILALAAERPNDFRIVAGVDRESGSLRDLGIPSSAPLVSKVPAERGAVVIDFSHHTVFYGLAQHCATAGMPLVSGTTGIPPAELDAGLAAAAAAVPAMHAMNYSVGVNVLFQVAAQIAKTLGEDYDIEIVEAHHNQKVDAPSGTAYGITDAICAATGRTRADLVHGREGQVGKRRKGEIGVHAMRLGDVVGEHTAYFVGNGERITIGHLAHSRDIFAGGALRAAGWIASQAPGRYAMKQVLG
ncbi:MAG: 4-hydroxy-tetrahydrodipicolinate reductase, partial [Planctomycetes bacterium]|nr:4-hydroxy-tetrahydrodipicolinate reductase [Planctomycetota bacterium]